MKIKTGKFSDKEIETVISFIANTPNITHYSKKELLKFEPNNVLKVYSKNQMIGFCMIKELRLGDFSEIAILGVLNGFENQGIGKQLFIEAINMIKSRQENIYVVTKNPKVISMLNNYNFQESKIIPFKILLSNFIYLFSFGRVKEFMRKRLKYPNQPKFKFYTKHYIDNYTKK
jgi:ribosomal protein S18 acetylase RimI-like enzyme